MGSTTGRPPGVPLDGLIKAMIGYAGMAMCLTLVYLSMRAVMDIGGACADGGPYVVARSCPQGTTITLLGGIFGGILFVFIAALGGAEVGGIWSGAPLIGWAALFGALGWNFLDYGVFNAPAETGIDGGLAICGVLFWIMAAGGLVALVPLARDAPSRLRTSGTVAALPGRGQPARRPIVISTSGSPVTVSRDGHTATFSTAVVEGELPVELRGELEQLGRTLAQARASGETEASRDELARIAADFGAAIGTAMAETPMAAITGNTGSSSGSSAATDPVPGAPPASAPPAGAPPATSGTQTSPQPAFTEGTQALLDRLERLADMRDRGLLGPEEYETAKTAIMAELEGRT